MLVGGLLVGLVAVIVSARPWWSPQPVRGTERPPTATATPTTHPPDLLGDAAKQPLAVIAAYNAASIAAGTSGDRTLMDPYLLVESPVRQEIATEYARRERLSERHHAQLVRWGVVDHEEADGHARIVTQEVWDDVIVVAGSIVDERRGSLSRVTYDLVAFDGDRSVAHRRGRKRGSAAMKPGHWLLRLLRLAMLLSVCVLGWLITAPDTVLADAPGTRGDEDAPHGSIGSTVTWADVTPLAPLGAAPSSALPGTVGRTRQHGYARARLVSSGSATASLCRAVAFSSAEPR